MLTNYITASPAARTGAPRLRPPAADLVIRAELVYSIVVGLGSVEVAADVELGGRDELLDLRICHPQVRGERRAAAIIMAAGLIKGTNGAQRQGCGKKKGRG